MMNEKKAQGGESSPDDCFAEKMTTWIWVFGAIVVLLIVFSAVKLSYGKGSVSSAAGSSERPLQAQHVAMSFCPYCPGLLDGQGRCNVLECPVYSPNWGQPVAVQQKDPVRRVLLKKLAVEVISLQQGGSVTVCSVYGGGWAEKAGIHVGDTIVRFNGRRVRDVKQFEALVAKARPESKVEICIIRNGKRIRSNVMVGEGEMEGVAVPNAAPAAWSPAQSNPWYYRR